MALILRLKPDAAVRAYGEGETLTLLTFVIRLSLGEVTELFGLRAPAGYLGCSMTEI